MAGRVVVDKNRDEMDWDSIQFPTVNVRPFALTPMYLSSDFQPDTTTYNTMNEWMRLQGRTMNTQAPVVYGGMDGFKEMPSVEVSDVYQSESDFDDKFKKSYKELAHQIAYRYPNPGLPRVRQGAIGGTWRHIKEVLGHHGTRVCFVDGLVSVYDSDNFSQALQPPLPYSGKLVHPPFAPTATEYSNGKRGVVLPKLESDVDKKLKIAGTPRHRGHYVFK